MKKTPHIVDTCRFIYEEKGQSAVFDYINKLSPRAMKEMGITWELCPDTACNCSSPAYRHTCLVCGQKTTKEEQK